MLDETLGTKFTVGVNSRQMHAAIAEGAEDQETGEKLSLSFAIAEHLADNELLGVYVQGVEVSSSGLSLHTIEGVAIYHIEVLQHPPQDEPYPPELPSDDPVVILELTRHRPELN